MSRSGGKATLTLGRLQALREELDERPSLLRRRPRLDLREEPRAPRFFELRTPRLPAPDLLPARYGTPTVIGSLSTPAIALLRHPLGAICEAPQGLYTGQA